MGDEKRYSNLTMEYEREFGVTSHEVRTEVEQIQKEKLINSTPKQEIKWVLV